MNGLRGFISFFAICRVIMPYTARIFIFYFSILFFKKCFVKVVFVLVCVVVCVIVCFVVCVVVSKQNLMYSKELAPQRGA